MFTKLVSTIHFTVYSTIELFSKVDYIENQIVLGANKLSSHQ